MGATTPSKAPASAPSPTCDKFPVARIDLVARAREIARIAKHRVKKLQAGARIGLVVLSLFDGIACVAQALQQLHIPVAVYEAVDLDSDGMQAPKIADYLNPPSAIFAGISRTLPNNVDDITEAHIIDLVKKYGAIHLVVGGSPCKDLSKARMLPDRHGNPGKPGPGFDGPTGYLFRKKATIMKWVLKHSPNCKYLAENSVFDHLPDNWKEAANLLGTPYEINALKFSCTRRTRAYWTNIALPPGWDDCAPPEVTNPDQHIAEGWHSVGDRTITASWVGEPDAPRQDTTRPYEVQHANGSRRYLDPPEAEGLMGLPIHGTAAPGVTAQQRLHGIGNGMDIRCLMRVLKHLRTTPVDTREQPLTALLQDLPWATSVAPEAGAPTLDVVAIAPWLTAGPLPSADHASDASWDATATHPRASYLISEWGHGVNIRYEGDRATTHLTTNNPSFWQWPDESAAIVRKEVEAGRWLGPFIVPPVPGFLQTPMAMVEQHDKFRHITNAKMGARINEAIPDPDEPLHLPTHKEIQRRLRLLAKRRSLGHVWMAKRDVKSAYRNVACRVEDWAVAGLCIGGGFYMDTALNFGTRSSPDKFCELSDAIEWVLRRWGVECVHYIDDFIFMGSSEAEVAEQVARFETVCAAFGIPIKKEKDVGPAQRLTVLGVEYDMLRGTVSMPQHQLDRIHAGCTAILAGNHDRRHAESLLGVITWAAQCMPAVAPFVSRLWRATATAQKLHARTIKPPQGVHDDMRWWLAALQAGLGADGRAIIPTNRVVSHTAEADAGTEWGIGGLDGSRYYSAPLPPSVRKRAIKNKRESSTFLELYNLLVMARVMGPGWTGCHVRAQVDNAALPRNARKGRGSTETESDMIREILLLQVRYGWSWELQWVPRERNEAADALSKQDMPRFHRCTSTPRTHVETAPAHLALPSGRYHMTPREVSAAVCGSSIEDAHLHPQQWSQQHRPHRAIFMPLDSDTSSLPLWEMLGQQVQHLTRQIPLPSATTGVTKYLRLLERAGVPLTTGLPPDVASMCECLKRFATDELLAYPVQRTDTGVWYTKRAVSASTACSYVDQVSKYWSAYHNTTEKPHLYASVKAFKDLLRRSLPHASRQKKGFTAAMMKHMVHVIRTLYGPDSMEEALVSTMWTALLRPGEAVTTPRYAKYDVSRHPSYQHVRFFTAAGVPCVPGSVGVRPARMEMLVQYSKTDQERLGANVVIGCTGDPAFCPVQAMWCYLTARGATAPTAPLFATATGAAASYAALRAIITASLTAMGASPSEQQEYAAHSFRVGAAQALALAGRSVEYIMALGRWRSAASIARYVAAPIPLRVVDARDMLAAPLDGSHATGAAPTTAHARAHSVFRSRPH